MTDQFLQRRAQVLRLKQTLGDNGRPLSFGEIGKRLGTTAGGAHYYVADMKGARCPCCFRSMTRKKQQP